MRHTTAEIVQLLSDREGSYILFERAWQAGENGAFGESTRRISGFRSR
jgi:hypothetical protein